VESLGTIATLVVTVWIFGTGLDIDRCRWP